MSLHRAMQDRLEPISTIVPPAPGTVDAPAEAPRVPPRLDRHFWLALLVAALVILPRSAMVSNAHNESMDANFHMRLGLRHATGDPGRMMMAATDPPLGQVLIVLPMVLTGCVPEAPLHADSWPAGVEMPGVALPGDPPKSDEQAWRERVLRRAPLYGNRLTPETLLLVMGVWKAVLFLPCVAVVFQWCRTLYGLRGAWLAAGLITIDPTFAAHVPVIALDSLGVTSIVIACYCIWRYFESGRTTGRLVAAGVAIAAAMLIKHTAVILPGVFVLYAAYDWVRRTRAGDPSLLRRPVGPQLWQGVYTLLVLGVIVFVSMFVLLGFDYSSPMRQCVGVIPTDAGSDFPGRDALLGVLENRQPAGTYIGCFVSGWFINASGMPALLWGEVRPSGWWYYFPAVATFKVPIGIGLVIALALASHLRRPWARGEMSVLIPMLAWGAFLMTSNMNYSFRHFLPAYAFVLMWAGRCVADGLGRGWVAGAVVGVVAAAAHVAAWHPDYMSYVNFPRRDLQYQITDSNLDWGQGLRQVNAWLAAHPEYAGKPVRVLHRWDGAEIPVRYWVGDRVERVERTKPPPTDGLLIISPVWVSGVYDQGLDRYGHLRGHDPVGWIGGSLCVYDMDRISKEKEQHDPAGAATQPDPADRTTRPAR